MRNFSNGVDEFRILKRGISNFDSRDAIVRT